MAGRTYRSCTQSLIRLMALAVLTVAAMPGEAREREISPDYTRGERKLASHKHAVPKSPPVELRPQESAGARDLDRARDGRRRTQPTRLDRIRERARTAALRTADAWVDSRGRREYFRVGLYDGVHQALGDSSIGLSDYRQGELRGWRDPEARVEGAQIGRADAAQAARPAARLQVEQEFADLGRTPRYSPLAGMPAYQPSTPLVPEPTLQEVFADFPMRRHNRAGERFASFLNGWPYDALQLKRSKGYGDFYDRGWNSAGKALEHWKAQPGNRGFYNGLAEETERGVFRETFVAAFEWRVARLYATHLLPAFEAGFDAGWAYGAFARSEWEYRRGLRAGFVEAIEDEARNAFSRAYPRQYQAEYRAQFDDWSRNPKPEIGALRLRDGNDDGVFEPGEELLLEYELINYGGGSGEYPLQLQGRVLSSAESVWVELPPRAIVHSAEDLRARIDPRTLNRTDTRLALALDRHERGLELRVTHPLQLRPGAWRVRRANLDGSVVLEVDVENLSRRPVEGTLALTTAALPGRAVERRLGPVEPGAVRRMALSVDGLDPLDLLAGRVNLDVDLLGDAKLQDATRYHIPEAARDLANRDLLLYMLGLAQKNPVSPTRVATTRELLMTRLREDWKAAVRRRGNPYKFDHRNDGATTALGDLVRTLERQSPHVRNHAVFANLSNDVKALAKQLPGIHPFLRKSLRKLARELP